MKQFKIRQSLKYSFLKVKIQLFLLSPQAESINRRSPHKPNSHNFFIIIACIIKETLAFPRVQNQPFSAPQSPKVCISLFTYTPVSKCSKAYLSLLRSVLSFLKISSINFQRDSILIQAIYKTFHLQKFTGFGIKGMSNKINLLMILRNCIEVGLSYPL